VLGYGEDEIRQFGLDEAYSLFHPEDMKIILEGIDFLRSDKGNSFSCVYRMRNKLGHWVWMYYNTSIMQRDEAGVPQYVLGLAVDFSPHIQSEKHMNELIAENRRLVNQIRLTCLTPREKEIIAHLTAGLACKEISNLLGISYYTTETHIRNIYRKFGVNNISALINIATQSGLVG
jgi:DNA-binding CsgD family transcriptional regulator